MDYLPFSGGTQMNHELVRVKAKGCLFFGHTSEDAEGFHIPQPD